MSNPFDIEEEAQASSDSSAMQRMMRMAAEMIETEAMIDSMEETVKDLKSRLTYLKTSELPDLMAENGLTSFTAAISVEESELPRFAIPLVKEAGLYRRRQ